MSDESIKVTIGDVEYDFDSLPEVAQRAAKGYAVANNKMQALKVDFELASAARDYFGSLVKGSMEGSDDTAGA